MYEDNKKLNRLVGLVIILMLICIAFIAYLVYSNYINKPKECEVCEECVHEECEVAEPEDVSLELGAYSYSGYKLLEDESTMEYAVELFLKDDNTFVYNSCFAWCSILSGTYEIVGDKIILTSDKSYIGGNECYETEAKTYVFNILNNNRIVNDDNIVLTATTKENLTEQTITVVDNATTSVCNSSQN